MSEKSRVKKYEDLRENILSDPEGDEISDTEKRRIIEQVTSPTPIQEPEIAQRAKDMDTIDSKNDTFVSAVMRNSIDAEQNEYFEDFIDEVRQYNIEKGNKSDYNTQIDILKQLKDQGEQQRKRYVEEIAEEDIKIEDTDEIYTSTLSSEEIAQQVRSLIFETQEIDPIDDVVTENTGDDLFHIDSVDDTEEIVVIPRDDESKIVDDEVSDDEKLLQTKLIEETQQLRKQVAEYEDELSDLSQGLSKNNVLINRILMFLIIILIGCVIFFTYLLLSKTGII